MKHLNTLIAAVVMSVSTSASAFAEKPNIVLIMADDLGFADLGSYGGEIETPVLDKLAANGLRFSQFYNTAKCHSSRVALLTGLYCGQAGNSAMSNGMTIAEALKPAGYFTAMTGKWHLKQQPTDRGFERYWGHLSGATNFFTGDKTFRLNGEVWNDFDEKFYTTDANATYANRFIDEALETKKPFFLYVAFNAPHYPLHAPEELVMKYRGRYKHGWDKLRAQRHEKQLKMGLVSDKWKLSPRPKEVPAWDAISDERRDWEDFRMAAYAAMVDSLDQSIGRIVDHLKTKGVFENTLIMFCSDNGACPFERTRGRDKKPWDPKSYWTYDTGWAHAGNTPFRWYKQNQHEGGISSPMIVHWPAGLKTKPGSITHQPGHLVDFMATALDVGGASYGKKSGGRELTPLEGMSLRPIFDGKQRKGHEFIYFHFSNNRAIRHGKWKIVSARGGRWELYDMENDRTELNDLSKKNPAMAKKLSEYWFEFAKEQDQLKGKQIKPVGNNPAQWKKAG